MNHFRQHTRYTWFCLVSFIISLFMPVSLAFADSSSLPELGSASGSYMTPAQEKRLGQAFMRSIKASETLLSEPFANEYIEDLGNKLVKATDDLQNKSFHFFILDNPMINAFAGPSGHIGIYTGLILTTQSESELAAVVAHEIAHVTQNHLMRRFHDASQLSIPSAAIILAAVVLGVTVGGDAAMATALGGQAAILQKQINFTRANEKEADRVGISTMVEAEFEPHAMPSFFERMGRANRAYASELPEFLRTHPVTTNRIADSMNRADQHPYKQYKDSLEYHLLRALLKEKSFIHAKDAEQYFTTNLQEGRHRNEAAQRYGLIKALIRQQKYKAAQTQMDLLLNQDPTEPVFLVLQSRLFALTDNTASGIKLLEDALVLRPGNYPINMQLSELYLFTAQYKKSINLLQQLAELRPLDDQIYKRLAEASGKNGNKVIAHSYQADYLYLNGQLEPAIQQLEIALREKTADFYLSSKLEAKLQALKNEFEILKQAKK